MKIMFLGESGDHNLSVIDPQYPLFVLGGVIVDQKYAENDVENAVRDFKLRLWRKEDRYLIENLNYRGLI